MTARLHTALEPKILKDYARSSVGLFLVMLIYIAFRTPMEAWFSPAPLTYIQSIGTLCLLLVLASSLIGIGFHHIISSRRRARNTFAFIFSCTLLKFLGTLLFFSFVV